MNTVRKSIVIAIASLGLGGAAIAASDPGAAPAAGGCHWGAFGSHGGNSAERMAKRQAALHDKLGLSTMQEAAWKTFTDKLQARRRRRRRQRRSRPRLHRSARTAWWHYCKPRSNGPRRVRKRSRNSMPFCHRNSRRSLTARPKVTVIISVEAEVGVPAPQRRRRSASGSQAHPWRGKTIPAVPYLPYEVLNDRRSKCLRENH